MWLRSSLSRCHRHNNFMNYKKLNITITLLQKYNYCKRCRRIIFKTEGGNYLRNHFICYGLYVVNSANVRLNTLKIYNSHWDCKLKNCNYSMLYITVSVFHSLKLYLTMTILWKNAKSVTAKLQVTILFHLRHLKFLVPVNLLFTALNVLVKALSDEMAWCLFLLIHFIILQQSVCCYDISSPKSWHFTFLVCGWQRMCVCVCVCV